MSVHGVSELRLIARDLVEHTRRLQEAVGQLQAGDELALQLLARAESGAYRARITLEAVEDRLEELEVRGA